MARHMTREQKQTACRLDAKGLSHKEIARDLNYSLHAIEVALFGRLSPQCFGRRMDTGSRSSQRR